jgi:hypothetical protein
MKQTVYLNDFRDAFYKMDRKDNFSYEGLEILFNYIEDFEQDTGEETELDVIALCCEYAESTIDELISDYSIDISDCDPDDDAAIKETVLEYMNEHTSICGVTSEDSVVYALF